MVRAISVFLQVALAATVVNGQLGEFFKNTFGGHVPLVALAGAVPDALVAKNVVEITYENWRRSINVTVDPTASEDAAQEWLFYFTKTPVEDAPQTVGPNNITYWDSVFNVRVPSRYRCPAYTAHNSNRTLYSLF